MIVVTKFILAFMITNISSSLSNHYQVKNNPIIISGEHFKEVSLKTKALKILQNKCNVCHKKRNPFMIFKQKNMDKRAKRIYKQVFVKKRMPKGDEVKLTKEEYNILETWLKTNL